VLAVLAVGGAVAVHHSDIAMSGMQHDGSIGATLELCLGVFAMIGAGVAAVAIGLVSLGRWRPARVLAAVGLAAPVAAPHPRARAGPPFLSLLCVRRR
jgi:hypothetical protein